MPATAPRKTREATLARAYIVGNGAILAAGDRHGALLELYAPSVAPDHQLLRRPARIGVSVDGDVQWISERFEPRSIEGGDAPIVALALASSELQLELWVETFVDIPLGVIVRRIQVTNTSERFRDMRVLFHHDLRLGAGEPHETAFRDGASCAIVHHAARRFAVINMETAEGPGVPLYRFHSRGSEDDPGAEAISESGRIEGPAHARGRVDSLAGAPLPLAPGASGMVAITIAAGETLDEARGRDQELRTIGVSGSLARTRAHWNLWLRQGARDLLDLPEDVATLYRRSLVFLRLHQTPDGAILSGVEASPAGAARTDYRWCWHRDAAVAADALDGAGYRSAARRYFAFTARSLAEARTLHAVVDVGGAPVGAPPDPDALALPLWALARHFDREPDVEQIGPLFHDVLVPTADRLVESIDPDTRLPASQDLWGERTGFHASTAAVVRGGLRGAAHLAASFGDGERARAWSAAADEVGRALTRDLYRPEWSRFARSLVREGRSLRPDATIDASLLWIGLLDGVEAEDSKVRTTVEATRAGLWVRTGVGGIARYERDPLGSVGTDLPEVPGNPSIAATLWLAQHSVRAAKREQDLDPARTLLLWCAARAEGWGALPEQLHPYRGETTAASPSTAAHAWLVRTVVDYVERLRSLRRCERCGQPAPARQERRIDRALEPSLPGLVAHAQR